MGMKPRRPPGMVSLGPAITPPVFTEENPTADIFEVLTKQAAVLERLAINYDLTQGARRELDYQRTIERQKEALKAAGARVRELEDECAMLRGEVIR